MNNCLVTTLKAAVNDNSLLKVGEMVVEILNQDNPTNSTNKLILNNGGIDVFVLEVENGEANLTLDQNMSSGWTSKLELPKQNAEQTVYFRNGNYRVRMVSKYNIYYFRTDSSRTAICVDVKNFQFSNNATYIMGVLKGDIENLSALTSVTTLYCVRDSNLSGDIAGIKNLTKLTNLKIIGDCSGDISNLPVPLSPMDLFITSPNITGDIASLSNKTNMKSLLLSAKNITGDIASLANLSLLSDVTIDYNVNITGDIASLANNPITHVVFSGSKNITGDIASLANCTSLVTFNVGATKIRGEVVDFIISQRSKGRTTGRISMQANNIITFNGKTLNTSVYIISWTASTITNETTSETVDR